MILEGDMDTEGLINKIALKLQASCDKGNSITLPTFADVECMMLLVRKIIFAQYLVADDDGKALEVLLCNSFSTLKQLLKKVLPLENTNCEAERLAVLFLKQLPSVKDLLLSDVEATLRNDPAVSDVAEVISCYPVVTAMLHYRVANALHHLHVPLLPRIITEQAHSLTGIDIHPAASIGHHFCIDHGTGVVIGATAIIGEYVTIYQGVTLGAKNFVKDEQGQPLDLPRHPIIGNRVVIYSNSTILGRITVGDDSVVGGNVWLTRSIPPHSRIVQGRPSGLPTFEGGGGI